MTTKMNADSMDLTDDYAFTGAVTGAGGGAWTMIGTAVASTSSSLTITGLDSTYDTYAIALSDFKPSGDGTNMHLRVGDSGGIETGSVYNYHTNLLAPGSTAYAGEVGLDVTVWRPSPAAGVGNATAESYGGLFYIHQPMDSTGNTIISGTYVGHLAAGTMIGGTFVGSMKNVQVVTQVQFLPNSGTLISGRMTVWGISHA